MHRNLHPRAASPECRIFRTPDGRVFRTYGLAGLAGVAGEAARSYETVTLIFMPRALWGTQ
jgi:hypothetical protein